MLDEFRKFVARGNVLDLAVGVVIGGAFGAITKSFVDHVITPPLGLLLGGVDFSSWGIILRDADKYPGVPEAIAAGAPVLQVGSFVNTVVNFIIVAFAMFVVVKGANAMQEAARKKEAAAPAAPAEPPADVKLLTEIRDLLRSQGR